jgi:hypothetical protein
MEHAKLLVHRGEQYVTREALAAIEAPSATATWKPIKHATLVDAIHEEVARRGIGVTAEQYAIQRKHHMLFGVMVMNWLDSNEFAAALAFRHANDMSEALRMFAGVRVMACDNMTLSGDEIILHRKHTPRFDLDRTLPEAFDRYQHGTLILQKTIEDLKDTPLSTQDAKGYIFDIFRRKLVPLRLFHPVVADWGSQHPYPSIGNQWTLVNCFTNHIKKLTPNVAMRSTVRLGKYFGLGREPEYIDLDGLDDIETVSTAEG